MTELVIVDKAFGVAHIKINRPKVRNAISPELMQALSNAFLDAGHDDNINVVVLSGVGDHFGAGYDLNYDWRHLYDDGSAYGVRRMLSECVEFESHPWKCPKPVVAMVRGFCLAGSCELSMMCCVTYASETSKFGEPEIRFSAAPPVVIMPWLTGLRNARELLYSGDMVDARTALRIGLVNKVFPDDQLEAETMKYARRVAKIDRQALELTKATLNRTAEIMGIQEAIRHGLDAGSIMEATQTPSYKKFAEVQRKEGLKAAIRWREKQFE